MSIHDQNYVRYEGAIDNRRVWWTIATTTLSLFIKFLRTKLILIFLWIFPLVMTMMVFLEYAARNKGISSGSPSAEFVSLYIQGITFSTILLFMASGAGVVADDLRYKTIQLYFSKPLTRIDYVIGKFLGVFILGSLVSIIPSFFVGIIRVAMFAKTEFLKDVAVDMGLTWLIIIVMNAFISILLIGLSSSSPRKGYVELSWIGVMVVPFVLSQIVGIATDDESFARLWSLTGNIRLVSDWILNGQALEGVLLLSPLILLVATAAGIGALYWRVSKLEGVA